MTLMNKTLYDALVEAGASEEKAAKAAVADLEYRTKLEALKPTPEPVAISTERIEWLLGGILLGVVLLLLS